MAKIALITGASSGIGKACALLFAKKGWNIIASARRLHKLIELQEEVEKSGAKLLPLKLDVRDKKAVFDALTNLPDDWSEVDLLINNAGLSKGLESIQDGKVENWELMIDTNIKGLLYVTKAILPGMVERKRGTIVNIASIAGHETYPGGNIYCATKAFVVHLSKAMRMDLLGTNIRVISVDPGMVETEFSLVRFDGDQERAKEVYEGIQPLTAEDVAETIYCAVSMKEHVTLEDIVIMPTQQASVMWNIKHLKEKD